MANRRTFALFLNDYLRNYMETQRQNQNNEAQAARQKDLSAAQLYNNLIEKASASPQLAIALAKSGIKGPVPFTDFVPTDEQNAATLSAKIDAAKNESDLPTELGLQGEAEGMPWREGMNPDKLQNLAAQLTAKRQALQAAKPPTKITGYSPTTDMNYDQYVPEDQLVKMGPIQTQPTSKQAGERAGREAVAAQPGKTEAEIANINATAGPKAKSAGQTAGAMASAQYAYQQPQQTQRLDGSTAWVKFNPKTGQEEQVPGPKGMVKPGSILKIPSQIVTELVGLNSAEVYGVDVLRDLHRLGLDNANGLDAAANARFNKWLATKAGISSSNAILDSDQQKTAFVNALLQRGLMGPRPSQYIAQLIQEHLPNGKMTPAKLAQVMRDVLDEASTRRENYRTYYGDQVKDPVQEPGKMTYKQWQEFLANEPTPSKSAHSKFDKR